MGTGDWGFGHVISQTGTGAVLVEEVQVGADPIPLPALHIGPPAAAARLAAGRHGAWGGD